MQPNTPLVRPTRKRMMPVLLGAATLVSLLLAFQQVVARSVERGESLRKTASAQADAAWRCRLHGAATLREACRAQAALDAADPLYAYESAPVAPGSP